MGRSTLAVAGGFVLWTILWLATNTVFQNFLSELYAPAGGASTMLLLLLLVLSVLFSIVSGFVTASIAEAHRARHALYLGIALLLVGLFVQVQNWYLAPIWYHLIFLGMLLPAALLGGIWQTARGGAEEEPL